MTTIKTFFQENLWASILLVVMVIIAVGVVMFYRIKNAQDELARRSPSANVYGNYFGEKKGRIVALLLFIGFIVFGWLLALPYIL